MDDIPVQDHNPSRKRTGLAANLGNVNIFHLLLL